MASSRAGGSRTFAAAAVLAAAIALSAGCASSPPVSISREWYELGNAWLDKGEWKKAGEAYSRAIALDPSFAGASYNLARALAEAGDYEGALKALDALARRDPGNARVLAMRAYTLYKKGDAAAALEAYRAVLKADPYSPDAVYNAALLELAAGEAQAAVDDLERLTSAKSEDGEAFLLLGRALDKLAADAKAGASAVAQAPTQAPTQAAPAQAAPAPGPAAAGTMTTLEAYERAKALGKADADALARMGVLYEEARRFSDAIDAYDAAVKADGKKADAWFSLARLRLVVASDEDKGLAALKGALDAGFSDRAAVDALLDEPDLPAREKVIEALKAKGLAE